MKYGRIAMKKRNKIFILLLNLCIIFLSGCRKEKVTILEPNINSFPFESLNVQHPERIKSIKISDDHSDTIVEFRDANIVSKKIIERAGAIENIMSDFFTTIYRYDENGRIICQEEYAGPDASPEAAISTTIYKYDDNKIFQYSSVGFVDFKQGIEETPSAIYTVEQKWNGYEVNIDHLSNKHKEQLQVVKSNNKKKTINILNDSYKIESITTYQKRKELSYIEKEINLNTNKITDTTIYEILKYDNNRIEEIDVYDFGNEGEKELLETIIIEQYDEYENWIVAKSYDKFFKLRVTYNREIEYVQ